MGQSWSPGRVGLGLVLAALLLAVAVGPSAATVAAQEDERFFVQTGFRVDDDTIWDYFNSRGGPNTFGFPISRTFGFRGFTVQFFQRHIIELGPDGSARLPNLLDEGLMPVSEINFSRFPGVDDELKRQTPDATDLGQLMEFIRQNTPERFENRSVRFFTTINNFVTCESAFFTVPCDPTLLPGFNLEVVGAVTSEPMTDPNNGNFIYQRFQRTILHYDVECNCTQALLLASYFKDVLMGQAPPDLMQAMAETPFINQYSRTAPNGLERPAELPDTNMQAAFEPQEPVAPE